MASQGAQAKAKESQAAVKALEALLTAYAAQLVPITAAADEASDVRPEHMKTGHKGVAASCEQGTAVCRVDLNQSDPEPAAAWTEPLDQALGELLTLHGGRIGWLYTLADAAPSGRAPEPTAGPRLPAEEEAGPAGLLESSAGAEPNISAQIQQLDAVSMKSLTSKADKVSRDTIYLFLPPNVLIGTVHIAHHPPSCKLFSRPRCCRSWLKGWSASSGSSRRTPSCSWRSSWRAAARTGTSSPRTRRAAVSSNCSIREGCEDLAGATTHTRSRLHYSFCSRGCK